MEETKFILAVKKTFEFIGFNSKEKALEYVKDRNIEEYRIIPVQGEI